MVSRPFNAAGSAGTLSGSEQDAETSGGPVFAPAHGRAQHRRRSDRSWATSPGSRLVWALVIAAAVPSLVLVGLWASLTRSFWFNEVWRAYEMSKTSGWWTALKNGGTPVPAGWFFLERASGDLFGSTELSLRLPTAMFLPLTAILLVLLARRWMSLWAAVVVALVGSLTGTLLGFAVQLSEYQIDAAAALAVILFHAQTWDHRNLAESNRQMYSGYGGIALACIFSTTAMFVAAPVLLLDLFRAARSRSLWPRAAAATTSGVVVLVYFRLWVLPMNALTRSSYWDAQFLPHHGIAKQITFVWDGLRGFLTQSFTIALRPNYPTLLRPGWAWPLTACFCFLLAIGSVQLARSEAGRSILAALVGSQVLTLIASYLRYWPFGFVRTNYYLIPLLILVAGVGSAVVVSRAVGVVGAVDRHRRRRTPLRRAPAVVIAALAAALILLGTGFAATYELSAYRQVHASAHSVAYGAAIPEAVSVVRAQATDNTDVVVAGFMAISGWEYYLQEYRNGSEPALPPHNHVLFVPVHGSSAITQLVRTDHPAQVFLYVPVGTTGTEAGLDLMAISRGVTCKRTDQQAFAGSGLLFGLTCAGPSPAPS